MLGRIKLAVQDKHGRDTTLDLFGIHELWVYANTRCRGLHGKSHLSTSNRCSVFLHRNQTLCQRVAKEVACNWLGAHCCQGDEVHLFDVKHIRTREAALNDFLFAITVYVFANPCGGQHDDSAVAISASRSNYALTWNRSGITSMQSKIVFQCTCLISTSRTVGSMFSKLFNVNIRELSLALMDCHWVIEPNKVLVLNGRDCGVAHKVVLGNMLNTDRC